jgi:hypothetical protein
VIRFRHVTKELFSSVTPFCFAKLAWTETNRDDLKFLLDPQREDVVLFLFTSSTVAHRLMSATVT